ncbi:MAG: hypothetical protein KME22_00220 [Hassallia sp. WJT32-NPBG1]|nr:hypothetical protein [Hassallia sp. WJT32-NPBG1]
MEDNPTSRWVSFCVSAVNPCAITPVMNGGTVYPLVQGSPTSRWTLTALTWEQQRLSRMVVLSPGCKECLVYTKKPQSKGNVTSFKGERSLS